MHYDITDRDLLLGIAKRLADEPLETYNRFADCGDREAIAALRVIADHGFADDEVGDVTTWGAYYFVVGRWILGTDDHGFAELAAYPTVREATIAFAAIEDRYADWRDDNGFAD